MIAGRPVVKEGNDDVSPGRSAVDVDETLGRSAEDCCCEADVAADCDAVFVAVPL